jgi:hypothetical protein
MTIVYTLLRWTAHMNQAATELFAVIGICAATLALAVLLGFGCQAACRATARGLRAMRLAADLRSLDEGTCDGLSASKITDMVDEFWILDEETAETED